jgi:hypothetical protein
MRGLRITTSLLLPLFPMRFGMALSDDDVGSVVYPVWR